MTKFEQLLRMDVRKITKTIQGFAYVPWALALAKADRPQHEVVTFKQDGMDTTVRQMFGGGVVAVDMSLGDGTDMMQRIYLPILDFKNASMEYEKITSRDVNDTISRCVARAVAMVHGFALSLYSRTNGDGESYVRALSVTPETDDLGAVRELRDLKEIKNKGGKVVRVQEYLPWHSCVAACRITDPSFCWEVIECKTVDPITGEVQTLPAMRVAGKGWMVGVRLRWRGRTHTQWLPIMGVEEAETKNGTKPMEHQAIDSPTVFGWHSSVVRCLAKAVAVATGYGIACYAGEHAAPSGLEHHDPEDDGTLLDEKPAAVAQAGGGESNQGSPRDGASQQRRQPQQRQQSNRQQPAAPSSGQGQGQITVAVVKKLLAETASDEAKFVEWLGIESLSKADNSILERGYEALAARKLRQQQQKQQQMH